MAEVALVSERVKHSRGKLAMRDVMAKWVAVLLLVMPSNPSRYFDFRTIKHLLEDSVKIIGLDSKGNDWIYLRGQVDNLKESQWADINSPTLSIAIVSGVMQ